MRTKQIRLWFVVACAALPAAFGCANGQDANVVAPQVSRGEIQIEPEAAIAGRSGTTLSSYQAPDFDPANFVTGVDHPYFPLAPGRVWTFEEEPGPDAETVVLEVLEETKDILGIAATVVRDRVYVGGQLVEDTYDWFAQDKAGNVWYLGEAVQNYEGGVPTDTEGSWEAGVAGAVTGIQMPAEPAAGQTYYQEYAAGIAEDEARIRRTDVEVVVPYGAYEDCVQVLEWTKLEPGHRGFKYYARGVGLVLESSAKAAGREGRVELVSVTGP